MKKFLTSLLILMSFFTAVHAEVRIYDGVGEYLMTEETVDFAKNQAALDAERNILDKICVHIKAQSTMINNELDNDEIIAMSAGILHVTDTKFKISEDTGGILVKAFVTAEIDFDELQKIIDDVIKAG